MSFWFSVDIGADLKPRERLALEHGGAPSGSGRGPGASRSMGKTKKEVRQGDRRARERRLRLPGFLVAAFVPGTAVVLRFRTARGLISSSTASSRTPISDPVAATLAALATSLTACSSPLTIGTEFFLVMSSHPSIWPIEIRPRGSVTGLLVDTPDIVHHVGAAIAAQTALAMAGAVIGKGLVVGVTSRAGGLVAALAGRLLS